MDLLICALNFVINKVLVRVVAKVAYPGGANELSGSPSIKSGSSFFGVGRTTVPIDEVGGQLNEVSEAKTNCFKWIEC
ncbi:MAG: hypothetical protein M0Z45_06825 [Actinomycetota bacterium]|nr:hypothetical protein [Actinomycetota bacterium]